MKTSHIQKSDASAIHAAPRQDASPGPAERDTLVGPQTRSRAVQPMGGRLVADGLLAPGPRRGGACLPAMGDVTPMLEQNMASARTEPVISANNKFGVALVNLAVLPPAGVDAALAEASSHGAFHRSFLVPAEHTIPQGFRAIGRGADIRKKAEAGEVATDMLDGGREAQLVVLNDSRIPQVLQGKKAAGHIALTVQAEVPRAFAASLLGRRGTPMSVADFLRVPSDAAGPTQTLDLVVCGVTGSCATSDAYANSYTDLGGSADVTADGHLESARETLLREVREEGGALVELLGTVSASTSQQETKVDVGGPFYIAVDDAYTKAVSARAMPLSALRDILKRARPDGREILDIAVVCLPPDAPRATNAATDAKAAKAAFEEHVRTTWFAAPQSEAQADAQKANKAVTRLAGLASKIFQSRGYFGARYPETWEVNQSSL